MLWLKKARSNKKSDDDFIVHLYTEYKTTMFVYAQRILNDNALAEDAVSEAFIKAIHYSKKLRCLKCHEIKTYIVNITQTASYDLIKKRKHQFYAPDDALEYIPDISINILTDLVTEESYQSIMNEFEKLPPKLYDVAHRSLVCEMSHDG
ncbi:MAG: sigma-70 family RNA polymerase sigma factor [Defluviitaleaceae bacterium]|nr:sigma-70 family RNA polymerase sigma factor [Defluviitaleaceae bacterium]